jgi:nitrogen fixation/metabolism regulation signal transduction histidine kinase
MYNPRSYFRTLRGRESLSDGNIRDDDILVKWPLVWWVNHPRKIRFAWFGVPVQRRLFLLFMAFSLIPVVVVLIVNRQISQRNLDFLDSPGLRQALDSSVELAQERLTRELAAVSDEARELSRDISVERETWPKPRPGSTYHYATADGAVMIRGNVDDRFFEELQRLFPADRETASLVAVYGRDWLVTGVNAASGRLVYARPLEENLATRLDAVVQGSNRFRQLRLYYSDLLRTSTVVTLLVFALVVSLISLYLSRRMARQIAGPVKALARGTEQVAGGNLDVSIDVDAPDELGHLVGAFNRMTSDLKNSKKELVRAERVAAWQGIARRLAHEIKNPLTPISLAMHRIEKRADEPATTDSIATVLEEVDNLSRLADEFSLYARLPEPAFETVGLDELLRSVVELYVDGDRVTVELPDLKSGDNWNVRADAGQIRQVLANVVKNAVTAMGGKGVLTVNLSCDAGLVTASVADTGPGIPEPVDQIFEPYFTTRSTGTGLGLAIARKIVEDHGGRLEAANRKDGGAELCLTLPATGEVQE